LFTTFTTGCFVKPGQFTQPVKAIAPRIKPATSAGCFTEVFAAAPIDLDYGEPNAVVEAELELIQLSNPVHQMELPVAGGSAHQKKGCGSRDPSQPALGRVSRSQCSPKGEQKLAATGVATFNPARQGHAWAECLSSNVSFHPNC